MKHRGVIVLTVLTIIAACTPSVPSKYIQPDDMEDILYDYYVAQAMARDNARASNTDYERTQNFLAVLKKYEVTEADFDSSLVYYYGHVENLKGIYARVNERLADEAKSLGTSVGDLNRYSQYSTTGDTANIWKDATSVLLMPHPTANRFDFTVKADTSFLKGDSFMFQFSTEYLWQGGSKEAVVCIRSEFDSDSVIQTIGRVPPMGLCQVRIPANRKANLRQMQGFIYLGNGGEQTENRRMMFVSQIQLIRFHNKQLKDEELRKDTVQKDSIQPVADNGRQLPDSAGRRIVGRRHGGTPLLPADGVAIHRMDAGKIDPKK
ncbi:MAG: DUF4296 domain-containing protein [Prevotella sp.]|nr:DUF4296 domain-containing protein [Prevotella sp.]